MVRRLELMIKPSIHCSIPLQMNLIIFSVMLEPSKLQRVLNCRLNSLDKTNLITLLSAFISIYLLIYISIIAIYANKKWALIAHFM